VVADGGSATLNIKYSSLRIVYFFAHQVMSVLVHENCIRYPKKFRALVDKNFFSEHDTSSQKYRICAMKCTPEHGMISKWCVRKPIHTQPPVKSPEK